MTNETLCRLDACAHDYAITVTADPGLQTLLRVINVLAVNGLNPVLIASSPGSNGAEIAVRFSEPPARLRQLCARIEATIGVYAVCPS